MSLYIFYLILFLSHGEPFGAWLDSPHHIFLGAWHLGLEMVTTMQTPIVLVMS